MLDTYGQLKQLLTEILSHIEHKGYLVGTTVYPLRMLHDELDEFLLSGSPVELIRIIRKIILTYRFYVTELRTVTMPDLLHAYNHNEVSITFQLLFSCLQNISRIVSQGNEEDFTPQI